MCTAFLASRASATPLLNPKTPLQLGQAVRSSIMKWDLNNCLVFFLGHLEDITVLICFPVCLTLFKRHFKC